MDADYLALSLIERALLGETVPVEVLEKALAGIAALDERADALAKAVAA
jgi:hypothetical protein